MILIYKQLITNITGRGLGYRILSDDETGDSMDAAIELFYTKYAGVEIKSPMIINFELNETNINSLDKLKVFDKDDIRIEVEYEFYKKYEEKLEELRKKDYKLVLKVDCNNYVHIPETFAVYELDINGISSVKEAENIYKYFSNMNCILIALNVNTKFDSAISIACGCRYACGDYLRIAAKPEINKIVSNLDVLQSVTNMINKERSMNEIADTIKTDAALSASVLKVANSAYFNSYRKKIDTLSQAIVRLGVNTIKNLLVINNLKRKSGITNELSKKGYIRALMCEDISTKIKGIENKDLGYQVGLFSILDNVFNEGMEEVINEFNFPENIKKAIVFYEGKYGKLLSLIKSYEAANWIMVEELSKQLNIGTKQVMESYIKALHNMESMWKNIT